MAKEENKSKSKDFYQVLGLKKECTATELRNAYKKLALRWHPDRCAKLGSSKFVEEAKQNFQAIQHAYSVLSDDNKRFLYDVGAYDSDDDENGMGEFLNEMAVMMSQTKPNENGEETFEELQELFVEMFQNDIGSFGGNFEPSATFSYNVSTSSSSSNHKSFQPQKFCLGVEQQQSFKRGRRRVQGLGRGSRPGNTRKHRDFIWL